jgi:hypothetical protein
VVSKPNAVAAIFAVANPAVQGPSARDERLKMVRDLLKSCETRADATLARRSEIATLAAFHHENDPLA